MRIRRKLTCHILLAAGFFPAAGYSAQAQVADHAPIAPAVPPPSATAPIFPLSEVRAGLHGVAYTVFQGTQPEAMNVEILGLLKNALGPDQDMILAVLQGSKPEYTGVVAGMSGSPVYIDGKLLGALSYRIGQFSKEPIAGITPIAEMLAVAKSNLSVAAAHSIALPAGLTTGNSQNDFSAVAGTMDLHPIETPLVFSGFSPEAVKLFGDRFRAMGLEPVAGLGGGASSDTVAAPGKEQGAPLIPGSAVSALLVQGDLEIAATCTVTYIDPHQLLACGHPITQFGKVSMPMTKAEVLATLASQYDSFKIINTTQTVGAFTEDRASAIRGVLGQSAQMIPVTIHVHGELQDHTLHIKVVDNPDITPGALMVSLFQTLMQTNSYGAELTYSVHSTVALEGYPSLDLDSLVAPTEQQPSAVGAALQFGQRFIQIYDNSARLHNIRQIDMDVDVLPGRRSIELEAAQPTQPSAWAGDTVTIEATLRPFHGEPRNLRIPVRLPQTLGPGPVRILLSGGSVLDRLTNSYPGLDAPSDLGSLIRQINSAHADDRLYVTLLAPDAQAVVEGHTLPSIPISMANVLEPLRANRVMSLNGESAVPVTSIPVDAMLTGQQIISIDVR